jgi:two-component system, response regulator
MSIDAERIVTDPPKVVLLDLKLPKVDGLEVLQRIKRDEQTRATPVVVLTSSREERDVIESYNPGANSYIVKPVDFEQFMSAIQQIGLYWMIVNQPPVPIQKHGLPDGDTDPRPSSGG